LIVTPQNDTLKRVIHEAPQDANESSPARREASAGKSTHKDKSRQGRLNHSLGSRSRFQPEHTSKRA
jgi:hypothetical protein